MSIALNFLLLSIVLITEGIPRDKCHFGLRSIINEYPTLNCSRMTNADHEEIEYSWINRIWITNSDLPVITANFTEKFPKLIFFFATNSNIREVKDFAFQNMQSLHRVELIFNNLTYVAPHIFRNSLKVASFNLTGNPHLIMPEKRPFLRAPQLRWLDLRLTNIREVSKGNFVSLFGLTYLSLAGNLIESLPDGVFHSLRHLKLLDLANNKLKTLSLNIFTSRQISTALYLGGNPWRCDCAMQPVVRCLIGYAKDEVKCEEPYSQKWEDFAEAQCCEDID